MAAPSRSIGTLKNRTEVTEFLRFNKGVFRVLLNVGNVHKPSLKECPSRRRTAIRLDRQVPDQFVELVREAVRRRALIYSALFPGDGPLVRFAEPGSGFDQRLQHGLQVECRTADHLEHIGGRSLLLQGLAQLAKQAGVFDRDNRLGRKILQQFDLLVAERMHFLPVHIYGADNIAFLQHRDRHEAACAALFDKTNDARVFREIGHIGSQIGHADDLSSIDKSAERNLWMVAQIELGILPPGFSVAFLAVDRHRPEFGSVTQEKIAVGGVADARRIRQHGIEDRLEVAV